MASTSHTGGLQYVGPLRAFAPGHYVVAGGMLGPKALTTK